MRFAATLALATPLGMAATCASSAESVGVVKFLMAQGALGDWEPYVAKELGYFTEEGVDAELVSFARQPDVATALISGRGDISISSLPTVLTSAMTGAPMKMIAGTQMATPKGGYDNWWAVLPDSPINKPGDLRGKKVDIYSQNSLAQVVTREIIAKTGVAPGDYQEISIPFPQSYSALEGGLVDVAIFIEPFFSGANEMSKQKYGKPLKVVYTYLTEFPEGLNLAGMMVNTNFAAKNPNAVRAALRATKRAAKWGNAHPTELKQIIAKYAGVPYEQIKDMIPAEMSEDGQLVPGMFDKLQTLMIKYKMVPNFTAPLKPETFLDLSFLPPKS
jgi:NitT/TauT family transport system substrate-binding protein